MKGGDTKMIYEIGETAGRVWQILNENGQTTLTQLKKKVNGSADLLNQAIGGWLVKRN